MAPTPPPTDWKARHDGLLTSLNKHYQRIGIKSLDEIPEAGVWQGWKQSHEQLGSLQQEKEKLSKSQAELQADFELRQAELSGLSAQKTKLQLLAEKYPSLGRFHANIETKDTAEEQEQAIQAFQASLQSYIGSQIQGAPPPPAGMPPAGGSATLEQETESARLEYQQATMTPGKSREEIQKLFDKYNALHARLIKETGQPDKYAAPRARSVE